MSLAIINPLLIGSKNVPGYYYPHWQGVLVSGVNPIRRLLPHHYIPRDLLGLAYGASGTIMVVMYLLRSTIQIRYIIFIPNQTIRIQNNVTLKINYIFLCSNLLEYSF